MNLHYTILLKIVLLTSISTTDLLGQDTKTWDFGLLGRYGKDYYKITYNAPYDSYKFSSDNSFGIGLFAEKKFAPISLIANFEYGRANNTQDLCECSRTADVWITDTRYHNIFGSMRARKYITDQWKIQPFVEIGIQADWFLGFSEKRNGTKSKYHPGAYAYDRFVPSGIGAIGIKYRSFALSAEYQRNLTKDFSSDKASAMGNHYIIRQGYSIKLAYSFLRI